MLLPFLFRTLDNLLSNKAFLADEALSGRNLGKHSLRWALPPGDYHPFFLDRHLCPCLCLFPVLLRRVLFHLLLAFYTPYFWSDIASFGHSFTHTPHSTHSSLTIAFFCSIFTAFAGQTSAHTPQPLHLTLLIVTAISLLSLFS